MRIQDNRNSENGPLVNQLEKGVAILLEIRDYALVKSSTIEKMVEIIARDPRADRQALVRVVTTPAKTIGRDQVLETVKAMEGEGCHKGILVGPKFTHSARQTARRNGIELFSWNALPTFNIFDHVLVPKHEILSKIEASKVLRQYRVKSYELPHVKANDRAIRLLGGRPGDVVRVTRKSQTAGGTVAYRYVV